MVPLAAISNVDLTNHSTHGCQFIFDELVFPGRGSRFQIIARLLAADLDAILVVNAGAQLLLIVNLYRLRGGKAAIIHWDLLLSKPVTLMERAKAFVKSMLLRNANTIICVHKDTADYEKYYRVRKEQIVYVPFKANCFDAQQQFLPSDGGYILSCGASYRDYETLMQAVSGLDIPTKIVLPAESQARYHNTRFSISNIPSHVEIIRHNFERDSWYRMLAGARIVVLPIASEAIQPAGISVYLEAMSMGKPVVISKCPSTNGILTDDQAMLVPRGDPAAMRDAILKLHCNPALRKRIADQGKVYADSLQGVKRLVSDLAQVVCDSVAVAHVRERR
jgi:glycosyltransferase involved in cell wall biosynthesis